MKKKNGKIELLRVMFIFCVIMTHTKVFLEKGLFLRGALAVDFFFFVSGYLMANSAYRRSKEPCEKLGTETIEFMVKKIKGIMPNFLIAYAIAMAVMCQGVWKTKTVEDVSLRLVQSIWELLQLTMAGFGTVRANGVDWYVSAMLLAMFILYPFARKNCDLFTKVIGPLIAIFLYGYMYVNGGSTMGVRDEMFFGMKGFFRAIAGISLGAAMHPMATGLSKAKLTIFCRLLISIAEVLCYGGFMLYCINITGSDYDFQIVLLVAIGVVLSFSHQGIFAWMFDNPVCYFLGGISLDLYLSHLYWARYISKVFADLPEEKQLYLYFTLILGTTFFLHFVSKLLKILAKWTNVKALFVKKNS